jgi:transcriptional regulator with XRE-family HTH domain
MEESILIKFGQRVKELRTERNLTQQQLADISGLHKNYIGMVERGERNPSLINIEILAKSFEISISELLNLASIFT